MSEYADGVADAANLLKHYGFDLGGSDLDRLIDRWLRTYPRVWLRGAAIEALYQGRYKAFSVEQILAVWRRKGQPIQHFNYEFERMVCSVLPQPLPPIETTPAKVAPPLSSEPVVTRSASDATPSIAASAQLLGGVTVVDAAAPPHFLPTKQTQPAPKLNPHQPIHQFIPAAATSEFYGKLKAVIQDDRLSETIGVAVLDDRGC